MMTLKNHQESTDSFKTTGEPRGEILTHLSKTQSWIGVTQV